MSQQDHDLMESVAADDQTINLVVPASPPRRDSMEDADSSLTRKRPRLDDGPPAGNRSTMPSDTIVPPADQLVEMTIRSQPPSVSQAPTEGIPSPPADSPPVIAVDEDEDDEDDTEDAMGDYNSDFIHIEHEEDYFRKFPFATPAYQGDYKAALRQMISHFQGGNPLDGTVLPQISVWLDSFPQRPSQWKGYYHDKADFWEEFALLVNKVLIRRHLFGDNFCDESQSEDEIFYSFFNSYLKLCIQLMRVDIEYFSQNPVEDVSEHQILCYRHLRHVNTILQGKSAVFQLLHKDYGADMHEMGHRLLNDFIEAPANGPQTLLRFADVACGRIAVPAKNGVALWTSQVLSLVGGFVFEVASGEDLIDRPQFYRDVLKYFRDYDADLQEPGKVVDVAVAKDLLVQFSTLLLELCQWDDALAAEIGEELLPFRDPDSPTTASPDDIEQFVRRSSFSQDPGFRATLISNAWKFKLLRKYVVKGRMELRVMSIGTMDNALVEIWREYNTTAQSTGHPVMQYLAEFLLHEQIIDYIISVDSHPQLISRSGNIVGFLVVTRRYSESQTDAIWRTISNSQDPRVVAATLTMLRNITSLMDSPELLYLCSKLYDLPIEHYSLDVVRFLKDISDKIRQKVYQWDVVDRKSRPWNVCIRVMQDTSPSRTSTKLTLDLFREACEQLASVSTSVGPEERGHIYTDCALHIAEQSPKATGSIRAIFVLCGNASYPDTNFFKQNLKVTRCILEELCSFVKTENRQGPNQFNAAPLDYRLDLLRFFVLRTPEAIPSDLYLTIWDHVIGKYALNNYVRDKAWAKFSETVKYTPDNEFCRKLITTYVPNLEPEYFTPGLYDFVAHYRFPTTRQVTTTDDGEKTLLQIRGGELLWRMIQTAPQGTIEERAAKQLAARYVEIDTTQDVSLEELEDAHIALVERCIVELLSDFKALRNPKQQGASMGMDVIVSDTIRTQMELRFARTLNFVKLLLVIIRTKSEFSRTPRSDSKVENFEPDITFGDTVEITYNIPSTSERQTTILGTGNTLRDLETRICQATGFTKVNMFFAGQRLDLGQKAHETLAELGLAPKAHVLVQKAAGSEARQPMHDSKTSCSIYEMTILNHFEDLFECMDSDDYISQVLFDFLSHFPFRERIADGVATGSASANDIFPPGKLFQAKYAACALQYKLREHLRKSTLDDTFLFNAVKLLVEALLNRDLISESITGRNELHLASFLVTILLEFLKERPPATTSYHYFSDGASFVDRLIKILNSALKAPFDSAAIVFSSYAAILEASLHSRQVWDAFITRPDIRSLHQILLTNQCKHLRQHIATSIASVCGGDLPSTSPLEKAETAAFFWGLISDVLPDAVGHAAQSEQLFDIAEQVFRSHDESNNRDEQSLRACLASWSDILLHYDHQEFVGRDDIDYVTLGFTKLLLCCIPSLKSFKKPLGVGNLMEQIYRRFLFVSPESASLPVLESNTRKELYDLVLALAEDGNSYSTLLNLTETLAKDDETISANSYGIERANEIRSPTGYVGLLNPRAICYSNSLVTQLFMNVNFRKFILGLDVADAASQRLLSETQSLFANLQNSFRKSADPRPFAACVKGIDGQPIDINIQMDADEFYNLLFDQWEGQMLSPDVKQRFRSFYGGQTVNQIKSKECEHVSERVETFFVVQCDVQGKANLHESLQAFVDGDVMEGDNKYKCESCGGKFVDAVKRTCLKDVPDNLIFHLKRFDFDLVEMRRSKINDCFVFPEQIDVSLYNVDHLTDPSKPRTEDIFELVGVLVHQGTSENGHYYSYIRERPCSSTNMNHWVEFNDRDVDTFDHHTIPYQAFGGWYDEQFPRQQKQFSAYMLFYQRKSAIENDHHQYIRSPKCGAPTVPVPAELEASINEENQSFVKDYTIHDQYHTKFTRQILSLLRTVNHGTCSEDHQQESQALRIVLEHLSQTLSRQRFAEYFDETMAQLRKTALACPTCCHIVIRWFASHETALTGLLLRCPHMKVRSQVRAFLIDTLRVVREKEPALYHGAEISSPDTDMEANSSAPSEGVLVEIVCRLRLVADDAWISARGWDDFFLTLCQVALLGNIETALLLNHGILAFGLKVLSMHAHSSFRASEPDLWRLVEKKKSIFNRLIELVYVLLSKTDIRLQTVDASAGDDRMEFLDRALSKFPLSEFELRCLLIWDESNRALAVLDRMIETFDCSKTETFYPGEALRWMLQTDNPHTQRQLYRTVAEGISALTPPYSDPYVRAAIPYCETSPNADLVVNVIDAVTKSVHQLRDTGGEVHIEFFTTLPTLSNETIDQQDPDLFYDHAVYKSRVYAVPLLLYDDDIVRKSTASHLSDLFGRPDDVAGDETVRHKYQSMRRLVKDLNARIIHEHDNQSSRSYMQPLINTCTMLVKALYHMTSSEDPALRPYQQSAVDLALIQTYQNEVEPRLEQWTQEIDTPLSTGGKYTYAPGHDGPPSSRSIFLDGEQDAAADDSAENYEQSDYGSESDDGPELEG